MKSRDRMGNVNRKATKEEIAHATSVVHAAFPDYEVVWGSHGSYGGHRAPRDHTISFRLRDSLGKYRSNVVWLMPEDLASLSTQDVMGRVARANGKQFKAKK